MVDVTVAVVHLNSHSLVMDSAWDYSKRDMLMSESSLGRVIEVILLDRVIENRLGRVMKATPLDKLAKAIMLDRMSRATPLDIDSDWRSSDKTDYSNPSDMNCNNLMAMASLHTDKGISSDVCVSR